MNKKSNALKILITSICMVILIIVLVGVSVKPNRLLGSVYNINDLSSDISKLKVGDTIKYEINGYSDWKVIYIDKENNTVDVVSKENLTDITIEDKDDFDNSLSIFQTEADKYVDGKYAIKARCVTRADLENFAFGEAFWTADNYNGSVAYTSGKITYVDFEDFEDVYYLLPYIRYQMPDTGSYSTGDLFNEEINGISEWFVLDNYGDSLMLMPKYPIKINMKESEDFFNDPYTYVQNILDEFRNNGRVWEVGHMFQRYGNDRINEYAQVRNFYVLQNKPYRLLRGWFNNGYGEGYKGVYFEYELYRSDSNRVECCYSDSLRQYVPVTKGFRPVVTLKLGGSTDKKDLNTNLSVGDNVNYNALEYKNWKVLSIDEANNTVDIISGGVVKNLYLQGKDDYENYEDILQSEADKYKSGSNVISARIVSYSDLANLNKINDRVNAKYWVDSKRQFNKQSTDDTSSPFTGNGYYNVGVMYYDINNTSIEKKWVSLYVAQGINQGNQFFLSGYNGVGELSFTAGIRPVITLKLDQVEKLDESIKNDVINSSTNNDQYISNEQTNNNTNNNVIDDTNKIIEKGDTNNYYNDYGNSEGDDLIKYILIGLIILNIAIIIQVILSTIIFKKMKKK